MKLFIKENKLTFLRLLLSIGLIAGATIIGSYRFDASLLMYLLAYALASCVIVIHAFGEIFREKRIGEKFLMTIASVGALFVGAFIEATLIVVLFEIGEMIEDL